MFYVYVLKCRGGSFYTGYTNDVEKRVALHNSGKGAKYTRSRLPVKLIHKAAYKTKSAAMKAEIAFKKLSRADKITHLSSNGKFPERGP